MAKQTILTEIGTGEVIYPQTLASLVKTADGGNVDEGLEKAKFKVFVDMWNARCVTSSSNGVNIIRRNTFGRYNEETGFFELNGLTDITYEQAIEIMRVPDVAVGTDINITLSYSRARTLFPISTGFAAMLKGAFSMMPNLEVIRVINYYIANNGADPDTYPINTTSTRDIFAQAPELREVKGILKLNGGDDMGVHFYGALGSSHKLETIWLQGICLNMKLLNCESIRRECWAYMIEYAVNTKSITITVHADVYAKLTGDTTNEAAAALTAEELAQWQQVLADAVAKNISFATT